MHKKIFKLDFKTKRKKYFYSLWVWRNLKKSCYIFPKANSCGQDNARAWTLLWKCLFSGRGSDSLPEKCTFCTWRYFETGNGNSEEEKMCCSWFCLIVFFLLCSRWIIWTKTGSVPWSTPLSGDTWRWWSSWSSATGAWLGSSRGCSRRATPSSRPWLLLPAWATPR